MLPTSFDSSATLVAFQAAGCANAEFPLRLGERKLAIRSGHFYAPQLMPALGIDPEAGVVRVSMAHYNTREEVDRLIEALAAVLG